MIQVIKVIERMPKGGLIIHLNIRLGNEAGGTCNVIDMSIMCYATDTSNEYQLSRLTSDFETRLAVPAL